MIVQILPDPSYGPMHVSRDAKDITYCCGKDGPMFVLWNNDGSVIQYPYEALLVNEDERTVLG